MFLLVTGLAIVASLVIPEANASTPNVMMGGQMLITLFSNDIQRNLFPDNAFYRRAKLDSASAGARKVQVPQAGVRPNIFKNPTTFPLTVLQREDDILEYDVHQYATQPVPIEDKEELEISYNKRADVLADHLMELETRIAEDLAYEWAPSLAANIIRTTSTTADNTALAPGATGTRKRITKEDFINAATVLNKQDIPQAGRVALVPADLMGQLLTIDSFVDYERLGTTSKLIEGVIGRLCGFDIMIRSKAVIYDNTATPVRKLPTAAGAATDNQSILFWHPQFVRMASSPVKVYTDLDRPDYLGSIMNAMLRVGGSRARTDQKGVVALVQVP